MFSCIFISHYYMYIHEYVTSCKKDSCYPLPVIIIIYSGRVHPFIVCFVRQMSSVYVKWVLFFISLFPPLIDDKGESHIFLTRPIE